MSRLTDALDKLGPRARVVRRGKPRNRDGEGRCLKVGYPTRAKAAKAARSLRKRGRQVPYLCPECGAWHTTTTA